VREFVQQANEGKLQQRDLEGGSISITNLGMYGVEAFSAIINPPQSAILAVGAALPAAVVVDGALEVGSVMSLVLSVDHRAVVVLRYFVDMTPDEIAAALGIPGGTARSRLHHAMRGMRAALEADSRPAIREVIE
jgi:hypothetical protein